MFFVCDLLTIISLCCEMIFACNNFQPDICLVLLNNEYVLFVCVVWSHGDVAWYFTSRLVIVCMQNVRQPQKGKSSESVESTC